MENQALFLQAYGLADSLFVSLRKSILKDYLFSWQEASLIVDCFIKMQELLPYIVNRDEKDIAFDILELYNKNYKTDIDRRFEKVGLFTLPYFESLISNLCEKRILKQLVCRIVNEITRLRSDWENPSEEYLQYIALSDYIYAPDECLRVLSQEFSKNKKLTCREEYIIERNKKGEFFSIPLDLMEFMDNGCLDSYDDSSASYDVRLDKINDAACVWPFKCGYARILNKDGRWGYISQEDNKVKWLSDNVLYAYDFCCDRARIQFYNMNGAYSFLGLKLEDCFNRRFQNASDFCNGNAIVSDEYYSDFSIDVWGNIIEKDRYRYAAKRNLIIEEREKHNRNNRKEHRCIYDPEEDIMNALSGSGVDPEVYGF